MNTKPCTCGHAEEDHLLQAVDSHETIHGAVDAYQYRGECIKCDLCTYYSVYVSE